MKGIVRGMMFFICGFFMSTIILVSHCGNSQQSNEPEAELLPSFSVAQGGVAHDSSARAVLDDITASRQNAITFAVEAASPAVVGINVTQIREYYRRRYSDPFFDFFFPQRTTQRVQSLGSGFIISADGYIVTNEHVVHNADEILVTLWGGERYEAEMVGADYISDIALLKIDGDNLPTTRLGDSEDVIRGEWVIALGNPFGLFDINSEPSVNVGVVSNINMDFGRQESERVYQDMIQTDAQINSGNSGGPLLNSIGYVIGMNTWIISGSRDMSGNIGIGFAIPINQVKRIVNDLRAKGKIDRSFWTGLEVDNMSSMVAYVLGLDKQQGVIITNVEENSPADQAGLTAGDVILEINGTAVTNTEKIWDIIGEEDMRAGDEWSLKVFRKRNTFTTTMILESPPD